MVDFSEILKKAQSYRAEMSQFLRDMIRIPSESCQEREVVLRIKEEMEKVGFDKVVIDPMGNIEGYIGHGPHVIAMDAHIDTVGVGDRRLWTECDPYEGKEDENTIWGRGGSDQEGGMAALFFCIPENHSLGEWFRASGSKPSGRSFDILVFYEMARRTYCTPRVRGRDFKGMDSI